MFKHQDIFSGIGMVYSLGCGGKQLLSLNSPKAIEK